MNKTEFSAGLRKALSGLPQDDIEERVLFYEEMIDDKTEEGATEEEAVASLGNVNDVASQIISDIPLSKLVIEKIKPKRSLCAWETALIVLGAPLWLPLILAAGAAVLSLYVSVWAAIFSLWAVEGALWACALGGVAAAVTYFVRGNALTGIAMLGAALFCAGLSCFGFYGCLKASKGILSLTKKAALSIKSRFVGKEKAE
ncbi:MAG: DUF1700 domain-containing protein [Clostridia bacterium]|nr:DUF1700 domain-containing protein [Clostridia bacterium]